MKENLLYERKNGFSGLSEDCKKEIFDFCEDYKKAISVAKTEREFCVLATEILEENGFELLDSKSQLKKGDKSDRSNVVL